MQGRVFTLVGSATAAMMPLGLIVAGPLADIIGVRAWFWQGPHHLSGGVAGFFVPALMNIESERRGGRRCSKTVRPSWAFDGASRRPVGGWGVTRAAHLSITRRPSRWTARQFQRKGS